MLTPEKLAELRSLLDAAKPWSKTIAVRCATFRTLLDRIEAQDAEIATLKTTCGHCGELEKAWAEHDALTARVEAQDRTLEALIEVARAAQAMTDCGPARLCIALSSPLVQALIGDEGP